MAGLFDFLNPLIDFLRLYIPVTPPGGTLFILLLSFALSTVTALANRFLVDVKLAKSYNEEVKAWFKEFNEAKKNNDRKLMAKLNRTKTEIDKAQATISKQRLKITAITFVPFILVFSILLSQFELPPAKTFSLHSGWGRCRPDPWGHVNRMFRCPQPT